MPPVTNYNIFTLSSESVVGLTTTSNVGLTTTSVVGLTTTSNVGLTTTSVVSPTTSGGPLPITQTVPPSADVVGNSLLSSTGTLIGIPANRTWFGALSVSLAPQSTYGTAATSYSVAINTLSATVTPASGPILTTVVTLGNTVGLTTTSATTPSAFGTNSATLHGVLIAVGSSSATLTLSRSGVGGQFTGSAMGWLL